MLSAGLTNSTIGRTLLFTGLLCALGSAARTEELFQNVALVADTAEAEAWAGLVSLPIPEDEAERLYGDGVEPSFLLNGMPAAARPVAWWERDTIPRRVLLYTSADHALGSDLSLSLMPGASAEKGSKLSPWQVRIEPFKTIDYRGYEVLLRGGSHERSFSEFDDLVLEYGGKRMALRLGTRRDKFHGSRALGGTHDWWQWGRVEPLLDTAAVKLVRVGGLLYNEDTFLQCDLYLELYGNGVARAFAHFVNTRVIGDGWEYYGIPVVGLTVPGSAGLEAELDGAATRFDLGDVSLDITDSAHLVSAEHPGRIYQHDGLTVYQPWQDQRVTDQVETFGKPFVTDIGEGKMLRGLAGTARFTFSVSDAPPKVAQFLAPPWLYALSEELWHGKRLPVQWRMGHSPHAICENIAKPDPRYHGTFEGGYTGAISAGNGGSCLLYSARYAGDPHHLRRGLSFTYTWADVMIDHVDWSIRQPYTGYYWKTHPYWKFNDLLWAYLETGDPYLRETAESCANSYTALMRSAWPSRSIGRGVMPVIAQVRLYQFLGEPYFMRCAAELARNALFTFADPDMLPGHQYGVGPNGIGNITITPDKGRGFADLVLCESAIEVALNGDTILSGEERQKMLNDTLAIEKMAMDAILPTTVNDDTGWLNYQVDMLVVTLPQLAIALNRPDVAAELEDWIALQKDHVTGAGTGRAHHAVTGRANYDAATFGAYWEDGALVIRPRWLPAKAADGRTATVWTPAGQMTFSMEARNDGTTKITPTGNPPCGVRVEQ
jgi:hypothetical protein